MEEVGFLYEGGGFRGAEECRVQECLGQLIFKKAIKMLKGVSPVVVGTYQEKSDQF